MMLSTTYANAINTSVQRIERRCLRRPTQEQLRVLLAECSHRPASVFWRIFLKWWPDCDDTWLYQDDLLAVLRRKAKRESPVLYFLDEQREMYERLPETIGVYRGSSSDMIEGLSWTLDEEVAEQFAYGHRGKRNPNPVVSYGLIRKEAIFGVFNGRKEAEIILDPDQLELIDIRRMNFDEVD
jgi:hypothetical protein